MAPSGEFSTDAAGERPREPVRRGWPLPSYLVALIVLFVVTAVGAALYGWAQARRSALDGAMHDADYAAALTGADLGQSIGRARTSIAQLALTPGLAEGLRLPQDPPNCTLTFSLPGADEVSGHVDLVRSDGSVACSSLDADPDTEYASAAWLPRALTTPLLEAPAPDPTTGRTVLLITAPVPGAGAVVGLVNLDAIGPALAKRFGGPRALELLLTTSDATAVISRSVAANRWVGADPRSTAFDPDATQGPDLDGIARLYGRAQVAGVGWRVYAGADRSAALNSTRRLIRDELLLIAAGLIVALGATFLIHRRITRPIARLSADVRAAAGAPGGGTVAVGGPAEVVRLANDFNGLLAAVDHELTERRRAEESARELERNYRKLFDSNPYPMFVFERDTLALLQANDAAVAHYGYPRDELVRLTWTDLCLPEDRSAVAAAVAEAGPIDRTALRHVRRGGHVIDVRVTSHALSFGGVKARCSVIEDVTETERLDRRLRQSQRLESLGQLAGGVAHDFNNLLSIILGYTNLAATEVEQAVRADDRWQPMHDDLGQVLRAVDRATKITHQLLSFARAEVSQPRLLDVNAIVTDLEPMLRQAVGEDIALEQRLAADLRGVLADAGHLEQVLVNLAVNARDAMPAGGRLSIVTDNVVLDEQYAAAHPGVQAGPHVRIRVRDTGSGMSPDTVEHAFEPFFTTKPKGQGTGLGLATIYGIVTQSGGHAEIESELDVGTTVTVLLPATDAATESSGPADLGRPPGHGETILLVEDEESLRTLTERVLVAHDYRVITAGDGAEALEVVARHPGDIDLLLTDVVMPRMPGHELARRLRDIRPTMPVVYLSGYAQPFLTAQKTLPAGVNLLTKPVPEAALLTALRQALDAGHEVER
jgi:PAS domain S-box-containing protein